MDFHYYAVYLTFHNCETFIGYYLGTSTTDIINQLSIHHNYRIELL